MPAPKRTVPPFVEDRPSWPPAVQPRRPERTAGPGADDLAAMDRDGRVGRTVQDVRGGPDSQDDREWDRDRNRDGADAQAGFDPDGHRGRRSLVFSWTLFIVETVLAAAAGLGLWLGFRLLWQLQPYLAVAGSAVVLVGMHAVAGWLRRRQSGAELDLLSSALVVAVGVAITVLPAAFAIRPG
jgi:hypothetical protein